MSLSTNFTSYWQSNEASGNLIDSQGSNTLTETNGAIASATGKIAGCRDYVVANARYFSINDNASLSPGAGSFTFAFWAQLRSTGADRVAIGKYSTTGNQREFMFLYNNTSNRFELRTTDAGTSSPAFSVLANAFGAPSLNTWYYIVGGRDGSTNELFLSVNAGTENTTSSVPAVFNGTGPFQMGALGVTGGSLYWDGLLDEIGYWNRRLTAVEIAWLYNGGTGRSYAEILAEATTRYFINGGVDNNWGTTSNWTTMPGGPGGAAVPTSSDDVFFNASSPNCTIDTTSRVCRQLDCNGYTGTLTFSVGLTASPQSGGIVRLASGMTLAGTGTLTISAQAGPVTITSAGVTIPIPLTLNGNSTTTTLADVWTVTGNVTISGSNTAMGGARLDCGANLTISGNNHGSGGTVRMNGTGIYSTSGSGVPFAGSLEFNTAGTITLSNAHTLDFWGPVTYTAGTVVTTGTTVRFRTNGTLATAGMTWNHVIFSTFGSIVNSNVLTAVGNCTFDAGNVSGSAINVGGSLSTSVSVVSTPEIVLNGTGSISGSGNWRFSTITINTAGTITLSGTVTLGEVTFNYVAGTLAGASTPTLVTGLFGSTAILNWGGATFPWHLRCVTAGATLRLSSGLTLGSTGSFTLGVLGGSAVTFNSTSPGTQRAFTVQAGTPMAIRNVTVADMDSSGGQRVLWRKPGTVSNSINWGLVTGGASSNGKGGGGGATTFRPSGAKVYAIGNLGLTISTNN